MTNESIEEINAQLAGSDPSFTQNPLGLPEGLMNVVNAAPTASRGLAQGVENFRVGGGLLFRQIGEKLGLADPETTQNIRDTLHRDQAATQAQADAEGYGNVNKVAEFAGEVAPNILLGGTVAGGIKAGMGAAKGAGLLADLGGAAASSLAPEADTLGDRGLNAVIGVGTAGALRGGAAARKALFGVPSEQGAKEIALRSLGMTPRASQIAPEGSLAQKVYGAAEQGLNQIPGVGIGKSVAQNTKQFPQGILSAMDELDGKIPNSSALYQATVDSPAAQSLAFPVDKVKQAAVEGLDSLKNILPQGNTIKQLEHAANAQLLTMPQLQTMRQQLDGVIPQLKRSATQQELSAVYNLRKAMSSQLDDAAEKFGGNIKAQWTQANQSFQQEKISSSIRKALSEGFKGDETTGAPFSLAKFMGRFEKSKANLAKSNLKPSPEMEKVIKNIGIVGNTLLNDGIKAGKSSGLSGPVTKVNAIVTGGLAALGVNLGAAGSAIAGGVALPVVKGMSLLATTEKGLNLLRKFSPNHLNNANARRVLTSAAVVGIADMMKHPDYSNTGMAGEIDQQRIDNMSIEDINAELARRK